LTATNDSARIPTARIELQDVPFPLVNTVMVPGGEWSELPGMAGTELRLKIRQAAGDLVNERSMKVFQYWAGREDGICRGKSNFDFDSSSSTGLSPLLATAKSGRKCQHPPHVRALQTSRPVGGLSGRGHLRLAATRE
jgi:hypothetical protein